ncbi:MAG: hypothetical protein Q8Q09_22945 [Deltaproteobacteria bacterium]|nr:hypothetical protein [Deltaproteobacteria bacterium]
MTDSPVTDNDNDPDSDSWLETHGASLRPERDHGHALLLFGGDADVRKKALISLADSVSQATDAPLVLVVRPRDEGVLADEITQCAESALQALRAPGGLYDEGGCAALPGLGGWLFRARAVGRSGILVVLENLDRWLDVRGDRDRARQAIEAMGALLEERERRPVSIVCSVRAADASGAPALPAALVTLFDARVAMGPARAVVRDPGSLVSLLAGRSFTRASLQRAVAAWAEVPDDETILVFSSPHAPTHVVGSALALPSTPEIAEISWSVASPAPAARPSDRALTSPSAPTESPLHESSERWRSALHMAHELRELLTALDPSPKRSTRQLERAFEQVISKLPLLIERFEHASHDVGPSAQNLCRRAKRTLAQFEREFAEAYGSAFGAWAAGAARPTMLADLAQKLHTDAAEHGARATCTVLLTGLRLDHWRSLRDALLLQNHNAKLLSEGTHWAAKPVTVGMQRTLLTRGVSALAAGPQPHDEPPAPRSLAQATALRRETLGHVEIQRSSAALWSLTHTPHESLATRMSAATDALVRALGAHLASLPSPAWVLFAADVGAKNSPQDPEPSAFEVLLPHAFVLWGTDRV